MDVTIVTAPPLPPAAASPMMAANLLPPKTVRGLFTRLPVQSKFIEDLRQGCDTGLPCSAPAIPEPSQEAWSRVEQ